MSAAADAVAANLLLLLLPVTRADADANAGPAPAADPAPSLATLRLLLAHLDPVRAATSLPSSRDPGFRGAAHAWLADLARNCPQYGAVATALAPAGPDARALPPRRSLLDETRSPRFVHLLLVLSTYVLQITESARTARQEPPQDVPCGDGAVHYFALLRARAAGRTHAARLAATLERTSVALDTDLTRLRAKCDESRTDLRSLVSDSVRPLAARIASAYGHVAAFRNWDAARATVTASHTPTTLPTPSASDDWTTEARLAELAMRSALEDGNRERETRPKEQKRVEMQHAWLRARLSHETERTAHLRARIQWARSKRRKLVPNTNDLFAEVPRVQGGLSGAGAMLVGKRPCPAPSTRPHSLGSLVAFELCSSTTFAAHSNSNTMGAENTDEVDMDNSVLNFEALLAAPCVENLLNIKMTR